MTNPGAAVAGCGSGCAEAARDDDPPSPLAPSPPRIGVVLVARGGCGEAPVVVEACAAG
jgi:hypothetical protein